MRPFLIISVSDERKEMPYDVDVEVPTDVPVSKLAADIWEVLRAYHHGKTINRQAIQLFSNRLNRILQEEETLGDAGIQMGDVIIIR